MPEISTLPSITTLVPDTDVLAIVSDGDTKKISPTAAPGAAPNILATDANGSIAFDTDLLVVDAVNDRVGIGGTPNEQLEITKNLRLPATTSTTGIIKVGANRFIHSYGTSSTFVGEEAGNFTQTGNWNTAVGRYALQSITTGGHNTACGYYVLKENTTGYENTAVGDAALANNTTGDQNTVVGDAAMGGAEQTGDKNIAIGMYALHDNTSGSSNTVLGFYALQSNTAGSDNLALGSEAGYNATGSGNVFIGYQVGYNETGSNLLYIDNSSTSSPLIWGDFDNSLLNFNADVGIGASPTAKLDINSDIIRLRIAKTPASASAAGNAGDICWDADYLYICISDATWRRIAHSSW